MATQKSVLDGLRVASPCPVSWASMAGDERVRFCAQCRQHVFNLSGMHREEAEQLIVSQQGRLCVRYYQRADGTVMTSDCPVGLRRKLRRLAAGALGLFLTLLLALTAWAWPTAEDRPGRLGGRLRDTEPFRTILEWLDPSPPPLMGKVCLPPPPAGEGAPDQLPTPPQ